MTSAWREHLEVLLDEHAAPEARATAATQLGEIDELAARRALLAVASNEGAAEVIQRASGEALAKQYLRLNMLYDAPLADLVSPAYLAFDEYVARVQRES